MSSKLTQPPDSKAKQSKTTPTSLRTVRFNLELQDELREIYKKYYKGSSKENTLIEIKEGFLEEVAQRFGWTEQAAYIQTEFLFRPPNYN